ncbi:GNAT family N-acetyltransferase [Flavobacterium sp. '19STA2R22 D10 B1']|uniref:GNAT family N-acetyltransferase n=1 Tax=Flavobacterium aerium TaxID=3037261 RepID=UPI00278C1E28|nr:GNAT family N-acetyltransferase [Flavobacterium sp. '19STA2R22 D10 B1']
MSTIHIKTAEDKDFESVYQFINALEEDVFDREIQKNIYKQNCNNPNIIYLLAMEDDTAVGFISCHIQLLLHHSGPIGEIQEMYVDASKRALGIGKILITELKKRAKDKGVLQLEVTSSFKRDRAHKFYMTEDFEFTHKKFVYIG